MIAKLLFLTAMVGDRSSADPAAWITLGAKDQEVFCDAFSPDGETLVSGGADTMLTLWDTRTWKQRATLALRGIVFAAAYSADGARLASVSGVPLGTPAGELRLRDMSNRKDPSVLKTISNVLTFAFSPSGNGLVIVFLDKSAAVYDATTGEL